MDAFNITIPNFNPLPDKFNRISSGIINDNNLLSKEPFGLPTIPEIRDGWTQLIIIGNGFDLECGLKSKYSDFFEPRETCLYPSNEDLDAAGKNFSTYITENGITVWDVILEEYADNLWNDIEKAIALWVVPGPKKGSSHFQRLLSLLNPGMGSDIDPEVRKQFSWKNYKGRENDVVKEIAVARFILQTCTRRRIDWNEEILYGYLQSQLACLENEFRKFMLRQLELTPTYSKESLKLLSDLMTPFFPDGKKTDTLTTILNFNYTNPTKRLSVGTSLKAVNVHGKLDGEIVFGIDGKNYLDDEHIAPFTKTYRLLGLHSENRFTLFENVGSIVSANKSLDVIKFYGHSLAEPDYSYFQAIFDEVDLYSSNTRLIFYFRNHDGLKDARTEMNKNVCQLLSEYGQTMDNVDHGKNLMHKLILEGRLSVLELKKLF